MKNKFIKKLIALTIIGTSVLTLNPIGASASWREDNTGWWYTQGSSFSTGWKNIDGRWYYFYSNGYMAKNTVIDGYALGNDGAWVQNNISNVKTYSKGESWVVDDQWEFKINSVESSEKRNQFSDKNPEQVLVIDYSYKNLGYTSDIQDLFFGTFTVMDEKGEVADLYPLLVSNSPKPTPVGGTCSNAMSAYGLKNKSSYVTIQVNKYKSGYSGQEKAIFKIPIE